MTTNNLALGAVTGPYVDDHSLSLRNLLGTNVKLTISFSLGAHACAGYPLSVPGAVVGQAAFVSVVTGGTLPGSVVFGPLKVTSADHVALPACNESGSTATATNVGLRIVTFG